MLKIRYLNKIYKSKNKKECHALKNINLTFDSKGLVFVLGKSGSGKSTLLNLLGGLDKATSGCIDINGNNLNELNERMLCNYRNSHIGFIFQDYHLLEELTIYENIALSLKLCNLEDKERVEKALKKVDLEGYGDRYPNELSGGEQQRVAIARAVVKNPKIILADEPTGNLDTNSAQNIISLLQKISKHCLIIIVSHNINDAYSYADRIIELSNGHVVKDISKNPYFVNEMSLNKGSLIYPNGHLISDEEALFIDKNIRERKILGFTKISNKYIPTPSYDFPINKISIKNKNLSLKNNIKLFRNFLKNKFFNIFIYSFIISLIMIILSLAQTVSAFNANEILSNEMNKSNQTSLLFNKVTDQQTQEALDANYHVVIEDTEIQQFYDLGYKGEIYPILNVTVPIKTFGNGAGVITNLFKESIYPTESLGTMIVDEEFLIEKFGEIKYLAKLDKFDPSGVIITDFVADAIFYYSLNHYNNDYTKIIGNCYFSNMPVPSIKINGIIYTGYKEKYSELINEALNNGFNTANKLLDNPEFNNLSNEFYDKLGYNYTFNSNFKNDFIDYLSNKQTYRQKIVINDEIEFYGSTNLRQYFLQGTPSAFYSSGWGFTEDCPTIPNNAKYIRIAYGKPKDFDTEIDPLYSVFEQGCGILEFSDGTIISNNVLNYKYSAFLDPDNGKEVNSTGKKSYISDFIPIPDNSYITKFLATAPRNYAFYCFYDENMNFISSKQYDFNEFNRYPLDTNDIVMTYDLYNYLFGTKYNSLNLSSFTPHTIKLSQYRLYDIDNSNVLLEKELRIVKLISGTYNICASESLITELANNQVFTYSLYFNGTEGIGHILDNSEQLNFEFQSIIVSSIYTMTKIVNTYIPLFNLFVYFLTICVILLLINFSYKMINDKMHEIGILKALGTKNIAIAFIFGLQIFLITLFSCVISTIGYYIFIGFSNDLLIDSILSFSPKLIIMKLDFLQFKFSIASSNCSLIVVLSLISFIIPMVKVKLIEPVKIIKTSE